ALTAFLTVPQAANAVSDFSIMSLFPFVFKEQKVVVPIENTNTANTQLPVSEEQTDLLDVSVTPPTFFFQRKTVVADLEHIFERLSLANDQTKTAALLLAKNGLDTAQAQTALAQTTLSLAEARLSLDTLAEATQGVSSGIFSTDQTTFKEQVASIQTQLTTVRTSLITALSLLKGAVDNHPVMLQ
ncbi:hypothetical protein IT401_01530, partial [Candidatus Nomurabacteria bacterium]|nr:hypothetical protein [Candidatus Nomurabacteria bacterium]